MATLAELVYGPLNQARLGLRGRLANFADLFGGKHTEGAADTDLHETASENLTRRVGTLLPPHVAANVADLAGLGNEVVSGGLNALAGRPFMDKTGFDWSDVASNRRGQERAIEALQAEGQSPISPLRALQDATGWSLADLILANTVYDGKK